MLHGSQKIDKGGIGLCTIAHPQASEHNGMTPQASEIFQRPLGNIDTGSVLDREYDVDKGMGSER